MSYDYFEPWNARRVARTAFQVVLAILAIILVPMLMDALFGLFGYTLAWFMAPGV